MTGNPRRRPAWSLDDRCARFPLLARMREQVLVFDGAMGTMLQNASLTLDDFAGKDGCNELLCETRPDVIEGIHEAYLEAGADLVETNSFGSSAVVLVEYDLAERSYALSRRAAEIARRAADRFTTAARPRFVAGSVGPTTKLVSLGHVSFREQRDAFRTQVHGLLDGGIDVVQIETAQDPLQVKAALFGAREAMVLAEREVPLIAQITVETTGTMLVGTEVAAALATLEALDVDVVGLNCALGPDLMEEHVRFLGRNASRFVSVLPNAGLPRNVGGRAVYDLTPESLARFGERFVREHGVTVVGGCCGTTPAHIRALAERVAGIRPTRRPGRGPAQVTSLYTSVGLSQEPAPLLVGERTNANGSKKFRELLLAQDWDGMVEMAREQVREGAHVLDVCTAFVGRPEARDMTETLRRLTTQVPLPLMIDTTQLDVLEASLELCGGRAIINSVNLEDGEGKADRIFELARLHGAALVALTIDEQGMAKTAARKVEIARRLYDLATGRHGLPADALLFDPLTFTIASGDEESRCAGRETLEAIRRIKAELPGAHTLLGVSNVSFGLRPYPRQVLTSVFLAEAIAAGLDAAIVHAGKIIPVHRLSADDLTVTRDLIFDRRRSAAPDVPAYDPLFAFIARFGGESGTPAATASEDEALPIDERLRRRIVDGNKVGLERLLDEALRGRPAVSIINEVLLEGMKTVGELFGSGRMQLPFVLQSAETMKAAVAYLQPFMEKLEGAQKGVLVLATVKGDVHDIGKNLVDIILSNNGYRVVNLGIKQPIDAILEKAEHEKADAIGLSGLLVKSTVVMKENLELMAGRGLSIPVVCGGAALNRQYVDEALQEAYGTGEVYYGADAFSGLRLMEELCGHVAPEARTLTGPGRKRTAGRRPRSATREEEERRVAEAATAYAPSDVAPAPAIPRPPFLGTRVVGPDELSLDEIYGYLNKRALFRGQWQYRRGRRNEAEYRHFVAEVVEPKFHEWCERAKERRWLSPALVYGYFPCAAARNDLVIFEPEQPDRQLVRIRFPRQPDGRRLCLADFFRPLESGVRDVLAVQLVTMGAVASEAAEHLFRENRYDDYLHFHGLAVESAEALAELCHRRVRLELGIAGGDVFTTEQLLAQNYQGSRYSFGYPACPNLEDQAHLVRMLGAERIGVVLSEEFQLVPEQSTSAIVVHHPEARYFSITSGASGGRD